ncbi:hypothetical protein ACIBHX_18745 [Nonomuraea sp. NPDC050536]|uniref:hypothetical protein n=1 Tax=Nonomuraea sp. NPDC050536 TaxID=3364366 RepID=UPI0037C72721
MGLRDKRVIGWLSGEFLSNLGDQFYLVAVTYFATLTAGARGAALVLTVGTLPKIVLMLFGGAFVDRLGPRLLMVGSDAVRTALAAGLAVSGSGPGWRARRCWSSWRGRSPGCWGRSSYRCCRPMPSGSISGG